MKNKLHSLLAKLLLLTFPLMLTFCSEDEAGGSFSYQIDGQSQTVQTISGQLMFEMQYDHEGRGLYLTAAEGISKMLSVAVSNWDFQNPPEEGVLETTYDATMDFEQTEEENPLADCLALTGDNAGVTLCDGGLITLIQGQDVYMSVFDGNTNGSITITSCNSGSHTVSGNFSAKVADFDGITQYTITGSFTNVKYMIVQ